MLEGTSAGLLNRRFYLIVTAAGQNSSPLRSRYHKWKEEKTKKTDGEHLYIKNQLKGKTCYTAISLQKKTGTIISKCLTLIYEDRMKI